MILLGMSTRLILGINYFLRFHINLRKCHILNPVNIKNNRYDVKLIDKIII